MQQDTSGRLRSASKIRVVVVSNSKPVSEIRRMYDAGHRCFGEDDVKELGKKASQLPKDIAWHFIGHFPALNLRSLLTRVPYLAMAEAVNTKRIAEGLDILVDEVGRKPLKISLLVNTSGQKPSEGVSDLHTFGLRKRFGIEPSECVKLAKHVTSRCRNLEFRGLMTTGMQDSTSTLENFRILANCRAEVCNALGIPEEECELSMGMSLDIEQAIELGCASIRTESTVFRAGDYPLERTQEEENNPDPTAVIVENSGPRTGPFFYPRHKEIRSHSQHYKGSLVFTKRISELDRWNHRDYSRLLAQMEKADLEGTDIGGCFTLVSASGTINLLPGLDERMRERLNSYKERPIQAVELRVMYPHDIPVAVQKDASSDLPDIDVKKYRVPGVIPIGEFVYAAIRFRTQLYNSYHEQPIFVYFNNTQPPAGALMSAADVHENRDDDDGGFLRITYTGQGSDAHGHGYINHEKEWLDNDVPDFFWP